jgi:hypothetical protein
MPDFYDPAPIHQLAINLFHGWGYNFYRLENQLRADDQLIRGKASWLLGQAAAAVEMAESAWRRSRLPPPTRAAPYPDPVAVAGAQGLERLGHAITAAAAQIRSQPVPENDRMTQRYRKEAPTLEALGVCDQDLVGRCEVLRSLVEGQDGDTLLAAMANLDEGLASIRAALQERARILL